MAGKKKWDSERMKATIEALRNKEASAIFSVPQTTPERFVKDRQKSSSETITTKVGRRQVLHCEAENDLAE